MSSSFKGAEKHGKGVDPAWLAELAITRKIKGWENALLGQINLRLKNFDGAIQRVGRNIGDIQFQFSAPIKQVAEYISEVNTKLSVAWVTFRTWNPITRKKGEHTLRFGPDTACAMVLVRSPKLNGGGFDWYLLARSKYQLAVQNKFVEFSRGWDIGDPPSDAGWTLLRRDFPGLAEGNSGAEALVKSIKHQPMGGPVHENTAEFMNDTSDHLIVVTLSKHMGIEALRELLITAKVEQEYGEREEYPELSLLEAEDLFSQPMAFTLEEAAKHLNANLADMGTEAGSMFREVFTMRAWRHFLAVYGDEFPQVKPQTKPLSELLDA